METEYLRSFCEVVRSGSFTAAAQRLYLSQPTVSQHVKIVEKYFQIPLFLRGSGPPVLTKQGKEVYEEVRKFLLEEEILLNKITSIRENSDSVTIMVGITTGTYILAPLIAAFQQYYPRYRPILVSVDWVSCINKVREGYADFGFVLDYDLSGLEPDKYWNDRLICIASKTGKWNSLRSYSEEELQKIDFVVPPRKYPTRELIEKRFERAGIPFKVGLEIWSPEGIKKVVKAGLGVGILLNVTANLDDQLCEIKLEKVDLSCRYVLFHSKKQIHSEASKAFQDFVRQFN